MKIIDSTNLGYLISKIKAAFWSKSDVVQISIDSTPTANSANLVTSGGVKDYVDGHTPTVPVSDVTVDNVSVVSNGVAAIPAIPTVSITDVTVGGISVVSNNVAVIPAIPTVHDNYVLSNTVDWNTEVRAGSATPSITLPAPAGTTAEEIRYIFEAASANATFTAPSGYILGDADGFAGLSAGNSLAYTDLVTGSIYECSFVVLDSTHISLIMKEHVTA